VRVRISDGRTGREGEGAIRLVAMDIWLLRHAAAEDRSTSGRDADRALTEDGVKRAERVARGLAALEPAIQAVWTSPYRRARQTAEAAARELGLARKLRETRALEPDREPGEVLGELESEELAGILLVGHEPHLGALLGALVAEEGVAMPLKKASAAWVEREGRTGTLRALLPARVLERIR
jgi:phosphohistidine phosphatase